MRGRSGVCPVTEAGAGKLVHGHSDWSQVLPLISQ
jgi:hypothetical protein